MQIVTRLCSGCDEELVLELVDRLHRAARDDDGSTLTDEIAEMRRRRIEKQKFDSALVGDCWVGCKKDAAFARYVDLNEKENSKLAKFGLTHFTLD